MSPLSSSQSIPFRRALLQPRGLQKSFFTCSGSFNPTRPSLVKRMEPFNGRRFFNSQFNEAGRIKGCSTLVWSIIALNAGVFTYWQYGLAKAPFDHGGPKHKVLAYLQDNFLLTIDNMRKARYWTIITSEFSHIDATHIAANLITFHQLSKLLVYTPGITPLNLAGLIFGSAISASLAFLVEHKPNRGAAGLGASGIVSGVTAAVALMAPKVQFLLFGFIPMPLWLLGVGTVAFDTYFLGGNTGIGHSAHLGGAAFGAAYYFLRLTPYGRYYRGGW